MNNKEGELARQRSVIKLKVTNWSKYQTQRKKGYRSIFLFEGFLDDAKVLMLTPCERLLFVACMLSGSQSDTGESEISTELLSIQSGLKPHRVLFGLQRLQELRMVSFEILTPFTKLIEVKIREYNPNPPTSSDGSVSPSSSPPKKRHSVPPMFDFDALYRKYPRKEGKKNGLRICKREIKTQDDYDSLGLAIARYEQKIRAEGTEPQYVKQFSSFMNCWRDCLDPDYGKIMGQSSSDIVEEPNV